MKDFTVSDIVKEIQSELPIKLPKWIIRGVILRFWNRIFNDMKTNKRNRYYMKHMDINYIYYDVNPEKELLEIVDLDETKVIDDKTVTRLNDPKYYERVTFCGTKRNGHKIKRILSKRFNSNRLYHR